MLERREVLERDACLYRIIGRDIYITNVVKYRRRTIAITSGRSCCMLAWLRAQVELIAPKSLFFWGAPERFVPGKRISGRACTKRFAERFPDLGTYGFLRALSSCRCSTTAPCAMTLMKDFAKMPKILENAGKRIAKSIMNETTLIVLRGPSGSGKKYDCQENTGS